MRICNLRNKKERQELTGNNFDRSFRAPAVLRNNETKPSGQAFSIWMMVLSCLLFALMGVFVKLASAHYSIGELVFYRSLIGLILMLGAALVKRGSLYTKYPKEHSLRSFCGAVALSFWFYSIGKLPLATAMTLNYTAPVWMVLFVIINARLKGYQKITTWLPLNVAVGFGGVICILQPALQDNQWLGGSIGLLSGIVSAIAFLQVAALGKLSEPGYRVVFYFSLMGMILGGAAVMLEGGFSRHTSESIMLLLAMGVLAAGAQWSLTYALLSGKTLINASLQYLTIAFSSVLGALIFGDPITRMEVYGMILVVVSGVFAAYFRSKASGDNPDARSSLVTK